MSHSVIVSLPFYSFVVIASLPTGRRGNLVFLFLTSYILHFTFYKFLEIASYPSDARNDRKKTLNFQIFISIIGFLSLFLGWKGTLAMTSLCHHEALLGAEVIYLSSLKNCQAFTRNRGLAVTSFIYFLVSTNHAPSLALTLAHTHTFI